jgi:hypothetical protein
MGSSPNPLSSTPPRPALRTPPHPISSLKTDPWEIRTRPFTFEGTTRSDAANPLGLNHLRDMTGQRNSACVRETSKLTCSLETREW